MTLAILVIFTVLGTVYWFLFVRSSKKQALDSMAMMAEALADRTADSFDPAHLSLSDSTLINDMYFAARSGGGLVWLVNSRGEVIFSTAMPEFSEKQLGKSADGYPLLPKTMRNRPDSLTAIRVYEDAYRGRLPSPANWLSVSAGLSGKNGAYGGEIILHRRFEQQNFQNFISGNRIMVAFLAAFLVAIFVFFFLSHNITKPIRAMIGTAEKVYKGDLTARVKLRHYGVPLLSDETGEAKQDDLMLLLRMFNTLIVKWEEQEKSRQDFLSSISHDLRSPLTSIKGYVGGMLDGTLPAEDFPEYLSIVQEETTRLQTLVQRLFEISLAQNTEHFRMTVFDLNELVKEQIQAILPQAREKKIRLEFRAADSAAGGSLNVVGDDGMIARVLQNILTNALRYCPEKGRIIVTTRKRAQADAAAVTVEDSGKGIQEKNQDQVFDRFFKEDKSRGKSGSGLGLYIARTIIKRHGQVITAGRSEELGGAKLEFTLALPESVDL